MAPSPTLNRYAEKLYGWFASEVVGRNILDITPAAATHAQCCRICWRTCITANATSGKFLVRRRDGTTFLAEVINSPLVANRQLIGIIGLSNDITARKRAERRQTVQYAVSQVLANFATLADAARCILQAIGESLEWNYGALWKVDQRDDLLVCVATWHTPARALAAFRGGHTAAHLFTGRRAPSWA